MKVKALLLCIFFVVFSTNVKAQRLTDFNKVFDQDSLEGFDEELAKSNAFEHGAFGEEFKVFMFYARREFIHDKYSLHSGSTNLKGANPIVATAACVNEDFEAGPIGMITSTAGLTGWSCFSGNNITSTGSCLMTGCCPNAPQFVQVIAAPPGGYMSGCCFGTVYPVYSVFGATPNAGGGYGNNFVQINACTSGSNFNRIVKSFTVSTANAFFQYAYLPMMEGSHTCCDNTALNIEVKNITTGSLVPCAQYSISTSPSSVSGSLCTTDCSSTFSFCPSSTTDVWHKWRVRVVNLTPYIGNVIQISVTAIDCPYFGHAGVVYFDAQCSPSGPGLAGFPPETISSCGPGPAILKAIEGYCTYSWAGPDPAVNGATSLSVTANVSGTYTVTMSNSSPCNTPVTKVFNLIFSSPPTISVGTINQLSCADTLNKAQIAISGGLQYSGTSPYNISWMPVPASTVFAAGNLTVTGMSVGVNTITVTDSVGCSSSATLNITPPPPVNSFSISAPSGTMVGCSPSCIPLYAINSNTALSNMSYTWSSTSTGVINSSSICATAPTGTNIFTISAYDPVAGSCITSTTFAIVQNTTVPGCTVNPVTLTLTCNGAPACFTATSSSPTNIFGSWYDSGFTTNYTGATGSPIPYCFGAPGIYAATFTNVINGCTSTQTVTVATVTTIPTMTVNALDGYTVTCDKPALEFNITATGIAPPTYSWVNVATSATSTPVNGGYTITVPGTYVAAYQDGYNCRVSQTITIMIDTVKPLVTAITNLPSNSFTLNCYNPVLTASAVTNPMLPLTNYSWTQPPNGVVHTPTISVNTTSVIASPTNFTVMAEGANGCVGRQKVSFYEDLAVPGYSIVFTPTAITCFNSQVALSPDHISGSTGATSFTFVSPPPTTTATSAGALFGSPGTYTMNYQLISNGCTGTVSGLVPLNTTPPPVAPLANTNIPCGSSTVGLTAGTLTTSTSYSYAWEAPVGAAMSCPFCYSTNVNMPGLYEVHITNTVNGCVSSNTVQVGSGSLTVGFTADPQEGFAPLTVNFTNATSISVSSGTTIATWSYGNGTTSSYTTSQAGLLHDGSTVYQAAGSYTVWLFVQTAVGTSSCVGTASAVVTVDLPSKINIPNVFTPNDDGVNDQFILQLTNLIWIHCVIYDRWGVKMYEVTTEKGNIAWDGKTLSGKEAPDGTYFFILEAEGKDGESYRKKGIVSLYR
jgi:gliding motility-associated-like protein